MKNFRLKIVVIFLIIPMLLAAQSVSVPKYEYRAVWLTTVENLDWPKTIIRQPSDITEQKNELIVLLDSLKGMNVNTIMFQTRVRGDVVYPSSIEPFSHVLTGVSGKNPGYDPLAFAIDECHKRGMQLHAWIVTMPLGKDNHIRRMGKNALPKKKSALCTHYKGEWFMEPGNPAVAPYLVELVQEIVSRYNIDGIHFDYIRYPDRTNGYPDSRLYQKHGKGSSLASWRRANITAIASALYKCVKELKPWVRVSCAPLGKYDDLTRYRSFGWDAYNAVFQDAQAWLRDNIMDALFPMLYFNGNNFYPFVLDWQENSYGRHIVPGIGIYRLMSQYGGWPQLEIERQLSTSRSAGTAGTAIFRAEQLLGIGAGVYSKAYSKPALVPPMDWACEAPQSPSNLKVARDKDGFSITWDSVASMCGHPAVKYNIYGSLGDTVNVDDIDNLLFSGLDSLSYRWDCRTLDGVAIAVTAVNAYGVESNPARLLLPSEKSLVDTLHFPEFTGKGHLVKVLDKYGRLQHTGQYRRKFSVTGLKSGCYSVTVYDRHGAVVYQTRFMK